MVEEKIRSVFLKYPKVIYGFTDIAYSEYAGVYQSALVFAVPHGELLTLQTYSEESFERGIQDARKTVEDRLCNEKRSLYIKTHGRKNACGLCMAACPIGTERIFEMLEL